MSHPFSRISRSNSVQTLTGKKYRHGRTLSLDAAAFAAASSSGPRFRIYFTQILLCFGLTIYIFLPSHLLRNIGSKAVIIAESNPISTLKNRTQNLASAQKNRKVRDKPLLKSSVAIVAACKNRQETLKHVLPEWRKVKGVQEIVIVDWSSDPPLNSIIEAQNDPRIKLIRVVDEKDWVLSRAYNLAVNSTKFNYIIRTDCDYSLKEDILSAHDLNNTEKGFYSGNWNLARNENEVHLNGAMIFSRKKFFSVGGYDERIQTYGWDDEDLYNRLTSRNLEKLNISYNHVSHVSHGDKKRAQSGVKFAQVQIDLNQLLLEKLPIWSKGGTEDGFHSTYSIENKGNRYQELKAIYIPDSLQKIVKPDVLDESFALALGRRLADDFKVPWDVLEGINSRHRENLLRNLMILQEKLDRLNSDDSVSNETILPAMNLEKAPTKAKILLIHAQHGLGNRMRAIGSALSFAESTARVPVLIWESDAHLAADFEALYDPGNLTVSNKFNPSPPFDELKKWDASWGGFKFYNYMEMEEGASKGEIIENDPEKHIYYKGAYIMEAPLHSSWERDNENLRSMVPIQAVADKLSALESEGLKDAIGVHIRNRTLSRDIKNVNFNEAYGEAASAEMQHWREQSSYTNFMIEMERIISEEDANAKFYIATDTKEVITEIESKFPGKILYVPRECDDRDSECVKFAMIDVYALSKTKRLLGSNWSSYTELAERLGGLKAELAGQDFGQHLANKQTEEKSDQESHTDDSSSASTKQKTSNPIIESKNKNKISMFDEERE